MHTDRYCLDCEYFKRVNHDTKGVVVLDQIRKALEIYSLDVSLVEGPELWSLPVNDVFSSVVCTVPFIRVFYVNHLTRLFISLRDSNHQPQNSDGCVAVMVHSNSPFSCPPSSPVSQSSTPVWENTSCWEMTVCCVLIKGLLTKQLRQVSPAVIPSLTFLWLKQIPMLLCVSSPGLH